MSILGCGYARYSQILKLLDTSGGARDYRYVCSLIVTVCDINTSREQSFSVTHEVKYEMHTIPYQYSQ